METYFNDLTKPNHNIYFILIGNILGKKNEHYKMVLILSSSVTLKLIITYKVKDTL